MHAPGLLADLAIVLLVASATGLLFRRLGQPAVLGYLTAGLIVGPYIPVPVFADQERTHALSELGVVLVMFVVGLELRLKRLLSVLPTAGVSTLVEVGALLTAGFFVGRGLGWDTNAAIFLGASIAISSTMVVSKVFEERPVDDDVREHVMSMLVIQDVLAIVLAAVLTAIAAGRELSAGELGEVVGRLGAVLVAIIAVGLMVVPRLVRMVVRSGSSELLVVVCMAVCFGLALAAAELGYSVALGAFFAGMLVAESGEGHRVEQLAQPLRDVFAAIFFVAIGMSIDPRLALDHLPAALLVFAVVLVAQALSVSISGVLSGNGLRRSVTAGLSLGQVGEFGFILSAIGIEAGLAPPSLAPIVVTVAVLTAFTTPLAVRHAGTIARAVDHKLPRRLQDLLSLYEAWFEQLRASRGQRRSELVRTSLILTVEGIVVTAIVVGVASSPASLRQLAASHLGIAAPWDAAVVIAAAALLALPPTLAFVRATRALGSQVATRVFGPPQESSQGRPRRVLEVSVQLMVLLAAVVPGTVMVLPFAGAWALVVVAIAIALTAWLLWRTAGRVVPQVSLSAERLVDLIARQSADADGATVSDSHGILGLDQAYGVTLDDGAHAVGKTLAAIDLRAITGAGVVAIRSADGSHRHPTGSEPLRAGDILALAGSHAAVERARALLVSGPEVREVEET